MEMKKVIITLKQSVPFDIDIADLSDKIKPLKIREFLPEVGLIMGEVNEEQMGSIRDNSIVDSVEEDDEIELPPPESDVQ